MNILIIEDNQKLAENIKDVLLHNKYAVSLAYDAKSGLHQIGMNEFSLIILDLNLPDLDGMEVCRQIRSEGNTTAILMLTARIDLESKVEGLDIGADDYLTKPFLMEELLARIRALVRRNSDSKTCEIDLGSELILDLKRKLLRKRENALVVSSLEYKLIEFLGLNKGTVNGAVCIYENVWGNENPDLLFSDTLKVHVSRVNAKVGFRLIKNKKGEGYFIE